MEGGLISKTVIVMPYLITNKFSCSSFYFLFGCFGLILFFFDSLGRIIESHWDCTSRVLLGLC